MRTTTGLKRRVWVLLSISIILAMAGRAQQYGETINPFHVEVNDTIAWQREFLEGYVHSPSVAQGEQVHFMVSTLAAYDTLTGTSVPKPCVMQIYRVTSRCRGGSGDTLMADGIAFSGSFYPLHDSLNQPTINTPFQAPQAYPYDYRYGCNWPVAVSYPVAETWPSGFYYARITVQGYAGSGVIPFVVRSAVPGSTSKILCVIAWNTYQAYNYWGGGSLYWWTGRFSSPDTVQTDGGMEKVIHTVSFRRPFANFWSDGYPYTTQFGQLDHRERAFIAWAEENNYPIEYCVDADVNADGDGIVTGGHYSLIVVPGHSEYWSYDQRSTLERRTGSGFKRIGGHLAFLAANNCYWKVEYRPEFPPSRNPDSMYCNKNRNGYWWRKQGVEPTGVGGHEARLIGVEYMGNNGIARIIGGDTVLHGLDRKSRVRDRDHWLFRGTGLAHGSEFGGGVYGGSFWETSDALVSGESDMLVAGQSPSGTVLLADTAVRPLFADADPHYEEVADHILRAQTALYEDTLTNSRVFAGGGFGWSTSLFGPDSAVMHAMHRSILDHFSGKKYIGNVYSEPPTYSLEWSADIGLDGDVRVLPGALVRAISSTVTVDSAVTFFVDGTLEINGSVTIMGDSGDQANVVVRSGGTLLVKSGGLLAVTSGANLILETGASVALENNAILNIETSGMIIVEGASTFTSGSGGRLQVSGTVHLLDSVTVSLPSASELRMQAGATMYLGWGSKLTSNGRLTAQGTGSSKVRFTSGSAEPTTYRWLSLDLRGGPDTLRHCVIEYSQGGVCVNNAETHLLDSCTIRHTNGYGVQAFNTSLTQNSVLLRDCTVDSNLYGVTVQNGRIDILQTSSGAGIRDNEYGINVWTGGKVYLNNTYITNNTDWGIYVNGSTAYACLSPNGISPGLNRVRDNSDGQIWVLTGSALLGNTDMICRCDPVYGESTRLDEKQSGSSGIETNCIPPCYSVFLQYAGYNRISGPYPWVKNETGASVLARLNYWGNPQQCPLTSPSLAFPGPGAVDYQFCQTGGGENWLAGKGDGGCEPQSENLLDSTLIRALIESLKDELVSGTVRARPSLHQLASLCGVGCQFSSLLSIDWRDLLDHVLTRNVPADIKNLVRAYRLQDMMDKKLFDQAITYANIISSIQDDELWFHAQSTVVYALVAKGQAEQANARYQTIKGRAVGINPTATAHLEYFLGMQAGSQGSPGEGLAMAVSGDVANDRPSKTVLDGNYPNPFNPTTTIRYTLADPGPVSLRVYDLLGREVRRLVDEVQNSGSHAAVCDASGMASGVYFYKLQAGAFTAVKRMVVVR